MKVRAAFPDAARVAARMRAASGARFGNATAGGLSGHAIALAVPRWLVAASGVPAEATRPAAAVLAQLESVQALLLLHLQQVDDEVDVQRQACRGDHFLAAASERLRALLGDAPRFRREFARLRREQEETSAWELARRGRPYTSARTADLLRIAGRAALLRWPAAAIAHLLARPRLLPRLERMAQSLLLVALLLDDLADVADDAARGGCNAVLLAGRAPPPESSLFHDGVSRGALFVARWIESEIDALARDARGAPGAAEACTQLRLLSARAAAATFRWARAATSAGALRAGARIAKAR
ncbi:MAG TPA: hypothetical protein VI356_11840 [Myxococcales bacterium]